MRCGSEELSTRSDGRELAPRNAQTLEVRHEPLLNAEARAGTWRIVEAFSRNGLPFELELAWAAGTGSGARATVTVASATRVSVFANALTLRAANLANVPNRVGVTVADGFAPGRNQWEVAGNVAEGNPAAFAVPPFAERLRIELANPSLKAGTLVSLLDGLGVTRSSFLVSDQPADGVPVGGVRTVEMLTNNVSDFRAVFLLSL